jgi:O-antigen ligase
MFGRGQLDLWLERGILALVLALLWFAPLATGAVGPLAFLVVQGLTIGLLALWAVRLFTQPEPKLLWTPVCWAVVAFVLYALGCYGTADLELVARREFLRVLVYAFVFLAVLNHLHRQEQVQIIAFTLIGLAVLEAGYAIYQFVTSTNMVWNLINPYKHRGSGTYICPNHLAGFLEMLLPLGVSYAIVGRLKPLARVLLGYATLMMLAGILVSVSRASWAATAVAVAVLCLLLLRYPNFRLRVLPVVALLLLVGFFTVRQTDRILERVKDTPRLDTLSHDMRLAIWEAAWRMWQDRPWCGVGPGHFDYRFREYRPAGVQLRPDRVHNDYLNTLTDWGIVGAAIAGLGLAALAVGTVQTWPHVRRGKKDFGDPLTSKFAFVLGAGLGLVALAIHSFFDFNLHIPANALLAVVLAALLSSHQRFATERCWVRVGPWRRALALAVLAGGMLYLGWQEVRLGRETFWQRRSAAAPALSLARVADLERAFAAEPKDFELAYLIGEAYREWSWGGYGDQDAMARKALTWYERALQLNPRDAYATLRTGMCLDWLGESGRAEPFYRQAETLDPAGYYTAAHIGWHFVQTGDYAAARLWLERSLLLQPASHWIDGTLVLETDKNEIALSYLKIVTERLAEQARPQPAAR